MSTHLKSVFSQRFLLAISLVLSMIAFSLVLAQPPKVVASPKAGASARTCPPHTAVVTYYTDASMTTACGWRSLTCYCNDAQWGCQTPYSSTEFLLCE